MPDPQTTNLLLAIPSHGSDVDTWDAPLNNDFSAVDGYLGGVQTISLASSPVTLTAPAGTPTPSGGPTQAQNAVLRFTGTMTTNVFVTLPLPGYYIVENAVTVNGNSLIIRAAGAGEIIGVPYGVVTHIYNDGTNVRFVNLPQVGSYQDYADSTVPNWLGVCTKPPFLNCNGSTFSAVTYPVLAAILGTTTLPDFRGRAPYYVNAGSGRLTSAGAGIDGNTRFAAGGSNGISLAANQIPSLNSSNAAQSISVALPSGKFGYTPNGDIVAYTGPGNTGAFVATYSPTANWAFTTGMSGLNSISVNYINASPQVIQNAAPGIVSGIRLIRAA